ncbi:MAG: hypothetical protein IPG07_10795 [Crocinitomicaceae bacterium]|nr:hypothetical protein [Crocinitomicaceae bacterium]
MKKLIQYIAPAFAFTLLVSCGGSEEVTPLPEMEVGHVIKGNVQGAEGLEAKLVVLEGGQNKPLILASLSTVLLNYRQKRKNFVSIFYMLRMNLYSCFWIQLRKMLH